MTRRCFAAAVGGAFALVLVGLSPRPVNSQTAPAVTPGPAAPIAEHVFIVSFDGGKPTVMRQSRMPTVEGMVRDGAATWDARTILPSITLISHTSMLTGVSPEKHHINWNEWEPEKGLVPVPTVFSLAKKANRKMVTAMFVGKQKFAHLFLPGSLDAFAMPDYSARVVARQAADYITEKKPNLCFIHFADSDGAGHAYGWGSPEQQKAFADEDDALWVIRKAIRKAGIEKTSLVILTADHGGHAKTHGSDSPEDMTIPWIAWGAGIKKGFAVTDPVTTYDTAATALYALGIPVPADFDGKPVVSAFEPRPVPVAVTSR
jgi:predicted AlkP superfamily pyrophosphatase or phosphodiesterase